MSRKAMPSREQQDARHAEVYAECDERQARSRAAAAAVHAWR